MEVGKGAFDTFDRLNVITIFIEATVDPVGREDRTKDLTSENHNDNLLSENSTKTLSGEDRDKEEFNCHWVADTRLCKTRIAEIIMTIDRGIHPEVERTTWV